MIGNIDDTIIYSEEDFDFREYFDILMRILLPVRVSLFIDFDYIPLFTAYRRFIARRRAVILSALNSSTPRHTAPLRYSRSLRALAAR